METESFRECKSVRCSHFTDVRRDVNDIVWSTHLKHYDLGHYDLGQHFSFYGKAVLNGMCFAVSVASCSDLMLSVVYAYRFQSHQSRRRPHPKGQSWEAQNMQNYRIFYLMSPFIAPTSILVGYNGALLKWHEAKFITCRNISVKVSMPLVQPIITL